MKRKISILLLLFVFTNLSFAQLIDETVAIVEITRREMLSKKQLENMYEMYNQQFSMYQSMMGANANMNLSKSMIVDEWIKKKVLEQVAVKNNVVITDEQCEQYVLEMIYQSNPGLPRDKKTLDLVLMQNFNKNYKELLDEYVPEVKSMLTIQKYVQEKTQKELTSAQNISDSEVQETFDILNSKGEIRRPVYLKVHHIFMRTLGLPESEEKIAYEQMKDVLKLIDNSTDKFYKNVSIYSEDSSTKRNKGLLGWISIVDENVVQTFGDKVLYELYKTPVNKVTQIFKTQQGYHIFLVSDKLLPEVYTLDSIQDPQSNLTFGEAIKTLLAQQKYQEIFAQAMIDIYEKEKKNAYIKIYDKGLR